MVRQFDPVSNEANLHQSNRIDGFIFHPKHIDDELLWKAFKHGDEHALMTIFDRFSQPMYNYGYKIWNNSEGVKDSIQELFIELWKNRTRLSDTDAIKPYLFKSLRRKLLREKLSSRVVLWLRLFTSEEGVEQSDEFKLIEGQESDLQRKKIDKILNEHLTDRQREAIFLRYYEEMDYDNIAAVMNLKKQVVYNLINKALERLRSVKQCFKPTMRP